MLVYVKKSEEGDSILGQGREVWAKAKQVTSDCSAEE